MRRRRKLPVALVSVVAVAVGAPSALGQQTPPEDVSGIDQYREIIPSPRGGDVVGGRKGKPKALPRGVTKKILTEGGREGPLLQALATLPELGAPTTVLRTREARGGRTFDPTPGGTRGGDDRAGEAGGSAGGRGDGDRAGGGGDRGGAPGGGDERASRAVKPEPSLPSAIVSAVTGESGGRPVALLLALLAITASALGATLFRRRRHTF